jgi:NurA domain
MQAPSSFFYFYQIRIYNQLNEYLSGEVLMPISYLNLHSQIQKYGQNAALWHLNQQEKLKSALELLQVIAVDPEQLINRIEQIIASQGKNLRFAKIGLETINSLIKLPAKTPSPYTLLAADGSQINPDPHAAIFYALINIGIFHLEPGKQQVPQEITQTTLLDFDEVHDPEKYLDEDILALKRDLNERKMLADLAAQSSGLVVTLTDGPLELFHQPKENKDFLQQFESYLQSLHMLWKTGAITAGYVDKPRADLVIRMLEFSLLSDIAQTGLERPFSGLTDSMLFSHLLEPNTRSAIFGMHSSNSKYYRDDIALHFYYLNIGRPDHPWIARIEIPTWVARDPEKIALLQQVLIEQCQMMTNRPYPYALHRAHEIALVSQFEKQQIEERLLKEMQHLGLPLDMQSNKLSAKLLSSRMRYKK